MVLGIDPGSRVAHLEEGAPFRWTAADGMQLIPNLGGSDAGGIAEATTPDGALVVGWCGSSAGIYQPFYWTAAGGTHGLGLLPEAEKLALLQKGKGIKAGAH